MSAGGGLSDTIEKADKVGCLTSSEAAERRGVIAVCARVVEDDAADEVVENTDAEKRGVARGTPRVADDENRTCGICRIDYVPNREESAVVDGVAPLGEVREPGGGWISGPATTEGNSGSEARRMGQSPGEHAGQKRERQKAHDRKEEDEVEECGHGFAKRFEGAQAGSSRYRKMDAKTCRKGTESGVKARQG